MVQPWSLTRVRFHDWLQNVQKLLEEINAQSKKNRRLRREGSNTSENIQNLAGQVSPLPIIPELLKEHLHDMNRDDMVETPRMMKITADGRAIDAKSVTIVKKDTSIDNSSTFDVGAPPAIVLLQTLGCF